MNRIQCSDKQCYDETLSILEKHMNDNKLNGGFVTNDEEFIILYDFFPRTQTQTQTNKYVIFVSYMRYEYIGFNSNGDINNIFSSSNLYNIFTDWWSEHYSEHDIPSHTKFATELVKCDHVFKKRTSKAKLYRFTPSEIYSTK